MNSISIQKFRELLVQLIYSYELAQPDSLDMAELMGEVLELSEEDFNGAQKRFLSILNKQTMLDNLIAQHAIEYAFERIQCVERAILRVCLYELLFDQGTNEKIVISEAIRLSNKFCGAEAFAFINGILDAIYKKYRDNQLEIPFNKEEIAE
ncbi:MAG: utilization substance protein [Chlamydiales bacterium]|jgi:N utilization substance protein B|nr:utilization substance protein [Chlamydiales bacterium]